MGCRDLFYSSEIVSVHLLNISVTGEINIHNQMGGGLLFLLSAFNRLQKSRSVNNRNTRAPLIFVAGFKKSSIYFFKIPKGLSYLMQLGPGVGLFIH